MRLFQFYSIVKRWESLYDCNILTSIIRFIFFVSAFSVSRLLRKETLRLMGIYQTIFLLFYLDFLVTTIYFLFVFLQNRLQFTRFPKRFHIMRSVKSRDVLQEPFKYDKHFSSYKLLLPLVLQYQLMTFPNKTFLQIILIFKSRIFFMYNFIF